MTAPSRLAGDTITKVITPGSGPLLVTEYMPGDPGAQIINTATTGTLYAGTSSSVQPSNGVPIPAGSSVQWTEPGQLWIVAGDDATDNITLIVTSRISSWAPSPEVVATAVATQLIDAGIPNVGLQETLYDDTPAGGSTVSIDTHKWASVALWASSGAGQFMPVSLEIFWYDADGNEIKTVYWDTYGGGDAVPAIASLAVLGPTMKISIPAGNVLTGLRVQGSNRPAAAELDTRTGDTAVMQFTYPVTAMTANSAYTLNNTSEIGLSGKVYASLVVGDATTQGIFFLRSYFKGKSIDQEVLNTADMTSFVGTRRAQRMIALPKSAFKIYYTCTTAGTSSLSASFLAAD